MILKYALSLAVLILIRELLSKPVSKERMLIRSIKAALSKLAKSKEDETTEPLEWGCRESCDLRTQLWKLLLQKEEHSANKTRTVGIYTKSWNISRNLSSNGSET